MARFTDSRQRGRQKWSLSIFGVERCYFTPNSPPMITKDQDRGEAACSSGDETSSQAQYRPARGRYTAHRMIFGTAPAGFVEGYSKGQPGHGDGEDCSAGEAGAERGVIPGQAGPAAA